MKNNLKSDNNINNDNNNENKIELRLGETLEDFENLLGGEGKVLVKTSKGEILSCDFLVGADGIHSTTRKLINEKNGFAKVSPKHCQYCYYRACVDLPSSSSSSSSSSSLVVDPFSLSFESWSAKHQVRFGYVPLQKPSVFWFFSVPSCSSSSSSAPTRIISPQEHQQLLQLSKQLRVFEPEKSKEDNFVSQLLELTPSQNILKTEIHKIPNVTSMPWTSMNHRCVLIGDACHATAPNLAQGAGLLIEDAIELALRLGVVAKNNNNSNNNNQQIILSSTISEYVSFRKQRALVVQSLADAVAIVGQDAKPGVVAQGRNFFMKEFRRVAPTLQGKVFESVVAFSLGGGGFLSSSSAGGQYFCLPSTSAVLNPDYAQSSTKIASMLSRAVSESTKHDSSSPENDFDKFLNDKIKKFRTSPVGGSGRGVVSVYPIGRERRGGRSRKETCAE